MVVQNKCVPDGTLYRMALQAPEKEEVLCARRR